MEATPRLRTWWLVLTSLAAAAQPKFAVVLTIANNHTSVSSRELSTQRCRLRGCIASLRAVGWRGDIVCLVAGVTSGQELTETLHELCDFRFNVTVPAYDAGPADANTSITIEHAKQLGRVPPPEGSQLQHRVDGALTSVKFHAWRGSFTALPNTEACVHVLIECLEAWMHD